jgi:RNA polymerase sigma-70 factor (ECF subfamily)
MSETSISLLERLRLHPDPASWERLVDLYTPLIRNWLGRHTLQSSDADDLTQDVLGVLVQELTHFRHDLRRGAFRRWLRTITVNRLRNFWRKQRSHLVAAGVGDEESVLDRLEDPSSDSSRFWDQEHDRHVLRRLMELIEPDFEPATWRAFRLAVLEGRDTAEVTMELGISANAVRIAKCRIVNRLRQEVTGLLD